MINKTSENSSKQRILPTVMNHSKNQKTCKNPIQQQQIPTEKLREIILKISNSEPNVPLSETQNEVLKQHLANFLSRLHITPDHPPYTWMIEKALQALNEEGGSSEDAISEFIKREHNSLPVAHMTMLKHHLQKMTEKRELLMINGGRYSLPGDSESVNPKRKRKRKGVNRKKRGNSEIKQKKSGQKEKVEEKQVQNDDVEVVREQKDLDEQQNDVTVDGNRGRENRTHEECSELNEHHNEPSTNKEDAQLSGQQNDATGNKLFNRRVLRSTVHKQKGKEQLDATEGSLQSSVANESGIGCNAGSVPNEPPALMMTEKNEHLQDSELQQSKLSLSIVEETADISNLYPQEILENEQPADNLPQLLSPEAPPGFEFVVVDDATENKAHTSSSVDLDLPKEDRVMHQSSDRPCEEEAVVEVLLKTKKQRKKHHSWPQTNRPMTRAQRKGTVTPNEQPISGRNRTQVQLALAMERSSEPKQPSIENSSVPNRAQRQLKRWSKTPGEPKSVSTSKVEQLALCDSTDQQLVLMEEPLSISKPLCASSNQHLVQMEEPLALAIREDALNLTDPQHEVHLKQPNNRRRGRSLKGKEDSAYPDTPHLKDVGSSKKITKKQNNRGGGRRRNAQ